MNNEYRRSVSLKNSESADEFLKYVGIYGSTVTTDNRGDYVVITRRMDDTDWEQIKNWASENGLLAN